MPVIYAPTMPPTEPDFKVEDGVLTFLEKPNYESAATTAARVYKVVVQASDGDKRSFFKVTVNLNDEEEDGSVKLSPTGLTAATLLQPQVGVGITAHTLEDRDGNASNARNDKDISEDTASWQWYRSSSKTETGSAISSTTAGSTGTADTYAPVAADVGHYLRVVATYSDGRGSGKTATAVSEYPTIARLAINTAPEFPAAAATRAVLEEKAKGEAIGAPVAATDKDSGEQLTYWIATGGQNGADGGKFDIDYKTGQLNVKNKLNFEGTRHRWRRC